MSKKGTTGQSPKFKHAMKREAEAKEVKKKDTTKYMPIKELFHGK
jgi:hypothetical protein